ncbi:MAG TPA: isochorismatase family protein [Trueperaceae bacterium]|nr:isochorismatase family protein [Trueperaceae bacterium]
MAPRPARRSQRRPLLVAIDVQRLYQAFEPWALPDAARVAATIARIHDATGCPLLCTRTVMPAAAGIHDGPWAAYQRRWRELAAKLEGDPALLDPLPDVQARCHATFDKHTYSAFGAPAFRAHVEVAAPDPLVIAGVETDICVLATVFGAIDRNLPVWLVTDALAGPDPAAARGVLAMLARMPDQVRLLDADSVIAELGAGP